MTICPYDHHACSCQPDEGVPCRGVAKIDDVVRTLRQHARDLDDVFFTVAADALEAQAARITALEAQLELYRDHPFAKARLK